jgi:hypothetical protein
MSKSIRLEPYPWEVPWIEMMIAKGEREYAEHELEMAIEEAEDFQHVEVEFCDLREDVDPYWPPPWLPDWYEEAHVEMVPIELSPHPV